MWVGMGNPCDQMEKALFYASTTITVGNGACTPLWDSPWVQGCMPKKIAPLIFEASTRKNWKVCKALKEDAWVSRIKITASFSLAHIQEFIVLWTTIHGFHLDDNAEDNILWKHTDCGENTVKSAYLTQFHGTTCSPMEHTLWKAWAPPKVKFFVWLAIQKGYRQPLGWPKEVGPIVAFAPCVSASQKPSNTSSSHVGSPLGYGA